KLSYQEINDGGSSAKHSASKGSSSTKSSAIDDVIYLLIADYEEDQHLAFEDLDHVNKEAFDEYEIKHQMAMLAIKAIKFEKKYGRPVQFDSREAAIFNKKLAKCFKCKKQVTLLGSADLRTNSTVHADDVVPADVVPASVIIFVEHTIPANRVIATEASVLAIDGIPADSEFAMMSLPSKDLMAKLENEKSINAKWLSTSKNLYKLVDSSMTARTKRGLGYVNLTGENDWGLVTLNLVSLT
nr:hypothetical protein [Tanacetum cinerariifolium]